MIMDRNSFLTLLPWLILTLICCLFFTLANQKVNDSLPYPTHIDEKQRLKVAKNMLQTGDLNPHYFHKPTLHIYLTAAGLTVGYIKEASQGKIRSVEQIGSVDYPFYTHPVMVKTAKQLFLLFATLAIFLTSYAAYQAYHYKILLISPALLIPFSDIFINKTIDSINVNMLGAFFIAALLSYLFHNLKQPGLVKKALIPGILCGLTVSSKYNFLAIYIPCLLTILLYERAHFLSRTVLLVFVSFITIIIVNPYFILDLPDFLNDTAYQVNHYMHSGHRGFEGKPGTSQFTYYMHSMIKEFGITAFLFSLCGLLYMFRLDWKKTLVFTSFPLFMLLLMSASKANFLRNLTPVFMLWSVFISMGMIACYQLITLALTKQQKWTAKICKNLALGITTFSILIALPYKVPVKFATSSPDSRNEAIAWIQQHVPKKSTIVVVSDLSMDTRPLQKKYKIIRISRKKLKLKFFSTRFFTSGVYFLLPEYGIDKRRRGKQLLKTMQNRLQEITASDHLDVLHTFGHKKVLLNYYEPVARGNPQFYIAKYSQQ